MPNDVYTELCSLKREAATLSSVAHLLGWDQETYMPSGGTAARAEQSSLLAGLIHEHETSARLGELIAACEEDAGVQGDPEKAMVSPCAHFIRKIQDRSIGVGFSVRLHAPHFAGSFPNKSFAGVGKGHTNSFRPRAFDKLRQHIGGSQAIRAVMDSQGKNGQEHIHTTSVNGSKYGTSIFLASGQS